MRRERIYVNVKVLDIQESEVYPKGRRLILKNLEADETYICDTLSKVYFSIGKTYYVGLTPTGKYIRNKEGKINIIFCMGIRKVKR